ncbi:hypothetical protein [Catenulispora acidiphila]|uniref:hypothetical protein n=1 Tax=Catenulispora acidiphila TaxID=304895 RepID=UPI00117E3A5E|nr:hypothetical protein [Catenulispora acidiphila]
MNMLWSRVQGLTGRIQKLGASNESDLNNLLDDIDKQLRMLAKIIEKSHDMDLAFINELYILRHLLTQTHQALHAAIHLEEERKKDPGSSDASADLIRRYDKKMLEAHRNITASAITLDAAENLLPDWSRTINGEPFWDRFSRVSDERVGDAAAKLADPKPHKVELKRSKTAAGPRG